jgi:hypothetical protein
LTLAVYEDGYLVKSLPATRRYIDGGVSWSVGYAAGNVLHGGADLRILVQHDTAPSLEGHGNLTEYRHSAGLDCEVY